jgi:hypothetical protein
MAKCVVPGAGVGSGVGVGPAQLLVKMVIAHPVGKLPVPELESSTA